MATKSKTDLLKKAQEELKKHSKDNISRLKRIEELLYAKPYIKVPLFLIGFFLLGTLASIIFRNTPFLRHSVTVVVIFFTTWYIIFFVVYMMRKTLESLFTAKNMFGLFVSYVLFIISILLLFSFVYSTVEDMGKGYLTYSQCSDTFDTSMIIKDSLKSTEYFYFSAVTFFTIGYGDICPMGWAKTIAILNGFIGVFINTVIMVIVISAYLERKEKK